VSELSELTDADLCVVGVSWSEKYSAQATFNDTESYHQGHLPAIKANTAYSLAFGTDMTRASSFGSPVKVAVIDSGVDWQHSDLQSNFWVHNQGWGIDATTINSNLVNYNPFDVAPNGHGTHIAGLVGAVSNNSRGIIGSLPFNAKIMAIKIFKLNNSGQLETNSTHLYNGLQFAILNGAEVMNLSIMATGTSYDSILSTALQDALQRGITVVAAMGNGSPGALVDKVNLSVVPATFSTLNGVMAVGSYDSDTGLKSSFSHYSPTYAEISAPGSELGTSKGVFSTLPTSKGSYGRLSGTSQSTAIVSGAAALAISLIKRAYGTSPSPYEVERLLLESATKNPALTSSFKDGNQLNLEALVAKVHSDYPLTKTAGPGGPGAVCP
jgi:subtilisin family serine protease